MSRSKWTSCTSLETDRRMSELRCRTQIDIIYSKMASVNARQLVDEGARSHRSHLPSRRVHRDVIRSFHVHLGEGSSRRSGSEQRRGGQPAFSDHHAFILDLLGLHNPLTLVMLSAWRGWRANQDRYFRRDLSNQLNNEPPSGARSTTNSAVLENQYKAKLDFDDSYSQGTGPGMLKQSCTLSQIASMGRDREGTGREDERFSKGTRFRQISFATVPLQKQGISADFSYEYRKKSIVPGNRDGIQWSLNT
ncbi:hypothetical protein HD806DRAFT_551184 [Xylariaceae sp. AK1471]|nr:hypothetical protein HD806DRAFT_551184 [Xylariaceae sp. AK1471]